MKNRVGERVTSTIDDQKGTLLGWDDDGAALVLWDGYQDVEATFSYR